MIFPSIVTYLDDGSLLTAYEARAQLATQPLHTIFNAKRFIGHRTRRSSDEEGHEESEDGEGGGTLWCFHLVGRVFVVKTLHRLWM